MFGDEGGVTYKVDWEPEEAVVLAIASASFRCVPDLLWAKQIQMQASAPPAKRCSSAAA